MTIAYIRLAHASVISVFPGSVEGGCRSSRSYPLLNDNCTAAAGRSPMRDLAPASDNDFIPQMKLYTIVDYLVLGQMILFLG